MESFFTEHFILLTDAEMERLVSASNREFFQPELSAFLFATRRLRPLRRLSLPASEPAWVPPSLTLRTDGEIVDQTGTLRGRKTELPLPNRPGEPQMRIGFDWFWSRFCAFLAENGFWATFRDGLLRVTERAGHPLALEAAWQQFWNGLAGWAHLEQSVGLALDSKSLFKQQASAWGPGDIPLLSEEMARFLIQSYRYGGRRRNHFKSASLEKAAEALEERIQAQIFETIPPPRFTPDGAPGIGGDIKGRGEPARCGGCGELLPKKTGYTRLALFLKDSDERHQSGREKDVKNRYCARCAATVFLCPIKLTRESLTVRFRSFREDQTPAAVLENTLRKYVAQTLHVYAGGYVSLHAPETVGKEMLVNTLGARHYSLWKVGTLFRPALFAEGFRVDVFPGEESFPLPAWALWLVAALAELDPVLSPTGYRHPRGGGGEWPKQFWRATGRALRHFLGGAVFHGFYTLISGDTPILTPAKWPSWKRESLQNLWRELEHLWKKETPMPLPDYPKIVGFAGLLLPFAERVQNALKNPNDRKRAVGKLLEEADRPIQYAYTAARETASVTAGTTFPTFIFCKRPGNHFFYDKALALLEWSGEDVDTLKAEARRVAEEVENFGWTQKFAEKIFVGPDQVNRVTAALVNEGETPPYRNEADWRAFAYQVKLALWSMFPQHLGAQNKEKE